MSNSKRQRRRILERYDGFKYGWLQYGKLIIAFIIIVFVVFRFLIGFAVISGDSMNNTLYEGEIVMYSRIVPEYKHGDIVSLHVPSGDYYIKRVIGTPGDVIDIMDKKVFLNGEAMEETYAVGSPFFENGFVEYPYTVGPNDLFVMGDNREVSIDSRYFGGVNKRQIRGKILVHIGRFYIKKVA